jgi:hypothetical protein
MTCLYVQHLLLLVLLVATATAALLLLLLPLVILQHLLVHPPELDMPSCADCCPHRLSPALLTLDPFLLLVATSITIDNAEREGVLMPRGGQRGGVGGALTRFGRSPRADGGAELWGGAPRVGSACLVCATVS